MPIDQDVINRVEEIGKGENQPVMPNGCPIFEYGPGIPVEDDCNPDLDPNEDDDVEDAYDPVFEEENDEEEESTPVQVTDESDDGNNSESEDESLEYTDGEREEDEQVEDNAHQPEISVENSEKDSEENTEEDSEEDTDEGDSGDMEGYVRRSTRKVAEIDRLQMSLKGKTYDSGDLPNEERLAFLQTKLKHIQLMMKSKRKVKKKKKKGGSHSDQTMFQVATNVMFTQMSANKGFKLFGERAFAAMYKELQQLDRGAIKGKPVVSPIDVRSLTPEAKRQALDAVNLIDNKRSGKIKGRTCANGSKQKLYLKEDESIASPTLSLEGLLTTLAIDAHEKRDVAIFDVPGAYLHAEMPPDKQILLKLKGKFVDIMCDVNPEHKTNIIEEKNQKVLYLWVTRAIYGCIESAMLWYDLYVSVLEKMGFKLNPYDKCVANKIINGKQCTICFYVDDNKVSHVDKKVVDDIIAEVTKHFGDLTVSRGNKHTFLGIHFEIENGLFKLNMKDQILEAIDTFRDDVSLNVTSPATKNLREVDETSQQLDKEKSMTFHSVVAKLLFIAKRARPDVDPTIQFLCTRVSKSTVEDWGKLKRCLQFLNSTINEVRIIGVESLTDLYTWIDAAYAVYPDMKSQTGGCMSYGLGILHGKAVKQKLNTKSSTEAEIVGVSDYLPYNIWMLYFLEHQGYKIMRNVVYQDNQSAIRMKKMVEIHAREIQDISI